jgi:hypothetical protein
MEAREPARRCETCARNIHLGAGTVVCGGRKDGKRPMVIENWVATNFYSAGRCKGWEKR